MTPKLILATGTMARAYAPLAATMTMVQLNSQSILWSMINKFQQRNIKMEYSCSGEFTKRLDTVVTFIGDTAKDCACIFIRTRIALSHKILNELERKLNQKGLKWTSFMFTVSSTRMKGSRLSKFLVKTTRSTNYVSCGRPDDLSPRNRDFTSLSLAQNGTA